MMNGTHTRIRTTKADKLASPEEMRGTKVQRRHVKKSHHKKQRQYDKKVVNDPC